MSPPRMKPPPKHEPDASAASSRRLGWGRFDPRLSFAAAIGWMVLAIMGAVAFATAEWTAGMVQRHRTAETVERLQRIAARSADALMGRILVRSAAMQALAADLRPEDAQAPVTASRLGTLAVQMPEAQWIAIRDRTGRLRSAAGQHDEDAIAPGPGWLDRALQAPVLAAAGHGKDGRGAAVLVLAVPLAESQGRASGVLAAGIAQSWLDRELEANLRKAAPDAALEASLLDPQGKPVAGSTGMHGAIPMTDFGDKGTRLVAIAPLAGADGAIPEAARWRVVVREPLANALAPVREARRAVLLGVGAIGLAGALAAIALAGWLTRRLDSLARQAREVRIGVRQTITVPAGRDEIHAIGLTLSELVGHLQAERDELARMNAELDARVSERAARIERLEREARHAEVERERLRLARGLHDTLANSLVSLLTQIRLVRKLHHGWDAHRLDAELAQAQQVAAQGLAEVRETIGMMRASRSPSTPLGAGLAALLDDLRQRCAVRIEQEIDPRTGSLSGPRIDLVLAIAREAIRNIERHAEARCVRLTLAPASVSECADDANARCLRLELADDGVGFDPQAAPPGHYGLVGLRERAQQLGASLVLDSAPGRGSRVILRFEP